MKKLIWIMILATLILTGCDDGYVEAKSYGEPFKMKKLDAQSVYGGYIGLWVDEETDVEYIIVSGENGMGICPRYHYDGTLFLR